MDLTTQSKNEDQQQNIDIAVDEKTNESSLASTELSDVELLENKSKSRNENGGFEKSNEPTRFGDWEIAGRCIDF